MFKDFGGVYDHVGLEVISVSMVTKTRKFDGDDADERLVSILVFILMGLV